jgi:DNA-binding NarL/FixJ family response regulator
MTIEVAVIDSHDISVEGVVKVLSGDHRFSIQRLHASSLSADVSALKPGLLIIADPFIQSRPELSSAILDALKRWAQKGADVLIYTEMLNPDLLLEGMTLGFRGYLIKSQTSGEKLIEAAVAVSLHSLLVADRPVWEFFSREHPGGIVAFPLTADSPSISPREQEVLCLMAEGRSDQEIAQLKSIALSTVETHVSNIYRKLGALNRFDCAIKAIRFGLVRVDATTALNSGS